MSKKPLSEWVSQLTLRAGELSKAVDAMVGDEAVKAGILSDAHQGCRFGYEDGLNALCQAREGLRRTFLEIQLAWSELREPEKETAVVHLKDACLSAQAVRVHSHEVTAWVAYESLQKSLNIWRNKRKRSDFAMRRLKQPNISLGVSLHAWERQTQYLSEFEERQSFDSDTRADYQARNDKVNKLIADYLAEKERRARARKATLTPRPARAASADVGAKGGGRLSAEHSPMRDMAAGDDKYADDNFNAAMTAIASCEEKLSPDYSGEKLSPHELLKMLGDAVNGAVAYAFARLADPQTLMEGEALRIWSTRLLLALEKFVTCYQRQKVSPEAVRKKIAAASLASVVDLELLRYTRDELETLLESEHVRDACNSKQLKALRSQLANILGDVGLRKRLVEETVLAREQAFWADLHGGFLEVDLGGDSDPAHQKASQVDETVEVDDDDELVVKGKLLSSSDQPKPARCRSSLLCWERVTWCLAGVCAAGALATVLGVGFLSGGSFGAALTAHASLVLAVALPLLLLSLAAVGAGLGVRGKRRGWCLSRPPKAAAAATVAFLEQPAQPDL